MHRVQVCRACFDGSLRALQGLGASLAGAKYRLKSPAGPPLGTLPPLCGNISHYVTLYHTILVYTVLYILLLDVIVGTY